MPTIQGFKSRLRRLILLKSLEDYTMEDRVKLWDIPPKLSNRHIQNCKLLVDREDLLNYVPKNGVCAEVGVLHGRFSKIIMETTKPKELHLYDVAEWCLNNVKENVLPEEVKSGRVKLHLGDSSSQIRTTSDDVKFDWVYIDGDHSYEGCKKDLEAAHARMSDDHVIVMNDYVFFAPSDFMIYGVVHAVNEFCIKHDYEILYMALQPRGYYDVLLKKIPT